MTQPTGHKCGVCRRFVISSDDLATLEDLTIIVFDRVGVTDCSLEEVGLSEFLRRGLEAAKKLPTKE